MRSPTLPEFDAEARQRQAENALRQSESNYRATLNAMGDAIHVVDSDLRIVLLNEAFKAWNRRLGLARNVVGRIVFEAFPFLPNSVRKEYRQVFRQGLTLHTEESSQVDGHEVATETWKIPICEDGKVVRIVTVIRDVTSRKQAEEALRQANEQLESKVQERTSKLRALAAELMDAENRERRRIANLLHDDLQQRLTALKWKVHELRASARNDLSSRTADQVLDNLTEAIALTRNLAIRVSPPILYELGFSAALDTLVDEVKTQFSLSVRVTGCRKFRLSSDAMQAFAYDAVRELLFNVHKHAGVKSAEVRMRPAGKKRIAVEVSDKGKGITAPREPTGTFGLFSIRERGEAMGVGFNITSGPGKGTCATLTMPIL